MHLIVKNNHRFLFCRVTCFAFCNTCFLVLFSRLELLVNNLALSIVTDRSPKKWQVFSLSLPHWRLTLYSSYATCMSTCLFCFVSNMLLSHSVLQFQISAKFTVLCWVMRSSCIVLRGTRAWIGSREMWTIQGFSWKHVITTVWHQVLVYRCQIPLLFRVLEGVLMSF